MKKVILATAVAMTMGLASTAMADDLDGPNLSGPGVVVAAQSLANDYTGRAKIDDEFGFSSDWMTVEETAAYERDHDDWSDLTYELAIDLPGVEVFGVTALSNKYKYVDNVAPYIAQGGIPTFFFDSNENDSDTSGNTTFAFEGNSLPQNAALVTVMSRVTNADGNVASVFVNKYETLTTFAQRTAFERWLNFDFANMDGMTAAGNTYDYEDLEYGRTNNIHKADYDAFMSSKYAK